MKRAIRIVLHFWRIAIQRNLTFRWQFLADILGSTLAVLFALLTFDIAYSHTQTIGDWGKYQTILLVGVFQLYTVLTSVFLTPNMQEVGGVIFRGELDGLLLKPVSAQLILSCRTINVTAAIGSIPGFCVIAYALVQLGIVPSIGGLLLGTIMLLSGVTTVYALWFMSMAVEFRFPRLGAWSYSLPSIFDFGKYPGGIYKGMVRVLFLTVMPILVVANFPTRVILGDLAWSSALYSLGLAGVLLVASRFQWRWALSRYTSAGS